MATASRSPRTDRTPGRLRPRLRTLRPRTPRPAPPAPAPAQKPLPEPAEVPIHKALAAAIREMPAVAKNGYNQDSNYTFRTLDDLVAAVRSVAGRHGLYWLPAGIEHHRTERGAHVHTTVKMRYKIVGPAGDFETAEFLAEGASDSDKSPVVAEQAALKYLLVQIFQVTVDDLVDGDTTTPTRRSKPRPQNAPPRPARTEPPRPPAAALPRPDVKATADRLARAACATRSEEVHAILQEAIAASAPGPEQAAIRLLGEKKHAAEQATRRPQDAPEAPDATVPAQDPSHVPAPAAVPAHKPQPAADARKVPSLTKPRPEPSPEQQARIKAVAFFAEAATIAGYDDMHGAARRFKNKHGTTLENADIHLIESFAAGMLPPGGLDGQDDPDTDMNG